MGGRDAARFEGNAVCQWRSDVNVMAAKVFNFPLNCFQLSKESSLVPHTNWTRLDWTPRLDPTPLPICCVRPCASRYVRSIKLHTKALRCSRVLQVLKVLPRPSAQSVHPVRVTTSGKDLAALLSLSRSCSNGLCCDCWPKPFRVAVQWDPTVVYLLYNTFLLIIFKICLIFISILIK